MEKGGVEDNALAFFPSYGEKARPLQSLLSVLLIIFRLINRR